jgi:DUF1680 family protein
MQTPPKNKILKKRTKTPSDSGSRSGVNSSPDSLSADPLPAVIHTDTAITSIAPSNDGDVMTEIGQEGVCIHPDCEQPRAMNSKKTAFIRHCNLHAEMHRQRCRQSYKRRLARTAAIGQQKSTIGEMQAQLTEERITSRRLRKRLETVQKEHDTFVSTITSTVTLGTEKGDKTIMTILQMLHNSICELVIKTENEDSYKQKLRDLENKIDHIIEEKQVAQEKVGYLKGQMLSQKQMMEILRK